MNLVKTEDYGIKGINYYFVRRESYDLTLEELAQAGVFDKYSYVDESIIPSLIQAQNHLTPQGYKLIIKDAYRSPELYRLVFAKRAAKWGEEATHRILNVVDMPHSRGTVVDVNLIDSESGEEIMLRDKTDDPECFFVDFYANSQNPKHQEFDRLQKILAEAMLQSGFSYGKKKEFWHFEFIPQNHT